MAGRKISSGTHSFPSSGRLCLNLVLRRKKPVQTLGWGWGIVMELLRLLREITLWSHFYRGSENTCLDRARAGRCGRRLRRA